MIVGGYVYPNDNKVELYNWLTGLFQPFSHRGFSILEAFMKEIEEGEMGVFIICSFKWFPICLFNVIGWFHSGKWTIVFNC
jgi:hypothetical protein